MSGRKKWSEIRRKSVAKNKSVFEHGDIVRIKKYPKDSNNGYGKINGFLPDGRIWVVNMSLPFLGIVSDYFKPEELEIESSRRTE